MIYISTRYNYYTYALGVDKTCYNDSSQCLPSYPWLPKENPGTPAKDWIYNSNVRGNNNPYYTWVLSSNYDNPYEVFFISPEGFLGSDDSLFDYGIRPVVYLTSDVKITGGDGTSSNPYKLKKIGT